MGGQYRIPSMITACRYGNFLASASVMIAPEAAASVLSISLRSLAYMCGEAIMWRRVTRIVVAVVSEPATLFCTSGLALLVVFIPSLLTSAPESLSLLRLVSSHGR